MEQMRPHRFCPECGQPLAPPARTGSATTKIDLDELDQLRKSAVRSLPAPPLVPATAADCPRCSSRPPPPERPRRLPSPVFFVLAALALAAGLLAYALSLPPR
jgi:hypothetical protein